MTQDSFQLHATKRDALIKKWTPILEHTDYDKIGDKYKREVTAVLLENQHNDIISGNSVEQEVRRLLGEAAPANAGGTGVALGGEAGANTGTVAGFDPVLISLVRRAMPQLIAYDIAGVQPMTQPSGLIFAMKTRYTSQGGEEALFNEAITDFSGTGNHDPDLYAGSGTSSGGASNADPNFDDQGSGNYETGRGLTTAAGERLGQGGTGDGNFAQMAFTIEKTSVTAHTRALKAEYSVELAQDLKAVHGLDAEGELSTILSQEILTEINREIVRKIYATAKQGAQNDVTTPGQFDLDVDSDGRWSAERFKGLLFQLERDANAIGHETRRGRGNFIICSADVASALEAAGKLDYAPALSTGDLTIDDTSTTFAGTLNKRYKVYIDPYTANVSNRQFYVVGYKGNNPYDAGLFYCPYVPLQMVRAVDPNSFQPRIGFKTRYGLTANPFVQLDDGQAENAPTSQGGATGGAHRNLVNRTNYYYRGVSVVNLL